MTVYDFDVTLANGETYKLDKYKGQPILIVNTATKCGLTGQFDELEQLYKKYQDEGLVVLGFPSDQFKQEVGSAMMRPNKASTSSESGYSQLDIQCTS